MKSAFASGPVLGEHENKNHTSLTILTMLK